MPIYSPTGQNLNPSFKLRREPMNKTIKDIITPFIPIGDRTRGITFSSKTNRKNFTSWFSRRLIDKLLRQSNLVVLIQKPCRYDWSGPNIRGEHYANIDNSNNSQPPKHVPRLTDCSEKWQQNQARRINGRDR